MVVVEVVEVGIFDSTCVKCKHKDLLFLYLLVVKEVSFVLFIYIKKSKHSSYLSDKIRTAFRFAGRSEI